MRIFLACFIVIPIVEMWVLLQVGGYVGALYTILLVLLTAVIGVNLLRAQGVSTLLRINQKMQSGQVPIKELGEGFILAIAGALLLTPGFVTDGVGFLLLTPGFRSWFASLAMAKLAEMNQQGTASFQYYSQSTDFDENSATPREDKPHDVIDAEFKRVDSDEDR